MKNLLATLFVLVLAGIPVLAQNDSDPGLLTAPTAFRTAWFGGIGAGIVAHDNGAFSDRLQSWSPLGENGQEQVYRTGRFSGTGLTLNAGGSLLFGTKYMVGASGEWVTFPTVESITTNDVRSEYDLSGGGGQLELGYAVINNNGTLVWPYLSLGYYGYSLDFHNNQSDSIPFFEGEPIAPGTTATYTGASFRPGIGVGLTRFLSAMSSRSGGLVLTARLGWGMFLSHPEWENEAGNIVNNGGKTPCYSGVGLSVSIGGGSGSF